jgi:monoamine oxidase
VEESFVLLSAAKEKAGEGVYVSATTSNNRRYYGVLTDQPALEEASSMWFQDQADSLELNRRMKVLMQHQQQKEQANNTQTTEEAKLPAQPDEQTASGTPSRLDQATSTESAATIIRANGEVATNVPTVTKNDTSTTDENPDAATLALSETAKRPLETSENDGTQMKRSRQEATVAPDPSLSNVIVDASTAPSAQGNSKPPATQEERAIQKFKYISEKLATRGRRLRGDTVENPGYRVLVATFCSVDEAAGSTPARAKAIQAACEEGGNFLAGDATYYYQYEVLPSALTSEQSKKEKIGIRTSMGYHSFLHNTLLPAWFPLSNFQTRQHKVLNMLNMKRDNKGNVKWDNTPDVTTSSDAAAATLAGGTRLPMQPRPKQQYQIGVIGGGIAGLACCQDLVTLLQSEGIEAKVTLLEARSRFGGRLWTDRTVPTGNSEPFPIELGASWIHGIDDNPLAALAKQAGIGFTTASEEVQMLGKDMKRIDSALDENTGKLFDDLLDHAADDCWSAPESAVDMGRVIGHDPQAAVRWYSSVFVGGKHKAENKVENGGEGSTEDANGSIRVKETAKSTGAPTHRRSSDRSIDFEIGKAISQYKFRKFSKLSADEHRMLLWNTKNVEYALGANISDLSMKYWDSDERHAFEGDHVLLKQGYSAVIDYMLNSLQQAGKDKFDSILNFPVGKVEYARKSTTQSYGRDRLGRDRKLVELSDTCSVSSEDGTQTKYFDFLVCTAPLGVLKESVQRAGELDSNDKLSFQPCLPFSKIDAISNVGFGLLDKAYLHFPKAFWRLSGLFKEDDQCLFGNVSGLNPHHYMFFDVGKCLASGENTPAILMSLISGKEAVACEYLSDKELVDELMTTLRAIFSDLTLPEPASFRITRWGQDRFARGSYTFLPPGATEQDFQLLQSPINGNGDSLLLEGSETMRLFFAGEHTTALHPSMAHGAMLSGMRAAKELVDTLQFKQTGEKDIDRVIPVALFRHKNPTTEPKCSLCHKVGGQVREGSLLAFKRGARQVLVHNNCAENSPEVEVIDSKWKHVIKAVNRGKALNCSLCSNSGATIGCTAESCFRGFHFSCSEDGGWRFDRDGKVFFCDLHRKVPPTANSQCDRVSLKYYLTKNPVSSLKCAFCQNPEDMTVYGKLLAFQSGKRQTCAHENCIKYTTIVDVTEIEDSRMGHEYRNIFRALDQSRTCIKCSIRGATVRCTEPSCDQILHFQCARKTGWNFDKRGKLFRCEIHRNKKSSEVNVPTFVPAEPNGSGTGSTAAFFNHNLLAQFGAMPQAPRTDIPSNLEMWGTAAPGMGGTTASGPSGAADVPKAEESSDSDESFPGEDGLGIEVMDVPLSHEVAGPTRLVRLERSSQNELWKISVKVVQIGNASVLAIAAVTKALDDLFSLKVDDVIVSINGAKLGTVELKTLRDVLFRLKQEVDLMMEVVRK